MKAGELYFCKHSWGQSMAVIDKRDRGIVYYYVKHFPYYAASPHRDWEYTQSVNNLEPHTTWVRVDETTPIQSLTKNQNVIKDAPEDPAAFIFEMLLNKVG